MNLGPRDGFVYLTKDNVQLVSIGTILLGRDQRYGDHAFYKVNSFTLSGAPRIQRLKADKVCVYSRPDLCEFIMRPLDEFVSDDVNCLRLRKNGRFALKCDFYFYNPIYQYFRSLNYG